MLPLRHSWGGNMTPSKNQWYKIQTQAVVYQDLNTALGRPGSDTSTLTSHPPSFLPVQAGIQMFLKNPGTLHIAQPPLRHPHYHGVYTPTSLPASALLGFAHETWTKHTNKLPTNLQAQRWLWRLNKHLYTTHPWDLPRHCQLLC